MTHIFILNPASGRGNVTERIIRQAKEVLEPLGERCEFRVTCGPGDAERFAREAAESGEEVRLYACGGDGTVNEVINQAGGRKNCAVTVIPCGSGNDFVKLFGADAALFQELKNFLHCRESQLDLIDCNGRLAVNICSVGLDARIGLGVEKYKHLPFVSGANAYRLSMVGSFLKGINRNYVIDIDGRKLEGSFALLAACSGRWYGGSFCPVPEAMPDDGLLDFVVVKGVSHFTFARLAGQYARGELDKYPQFITHVQGKRMEVLCDRPAMINVDGERLDGEQVVFRLSEKKLRFFYPAAASYLPEKAKREGILAGETTVC